jgi:aminoglycoside phosphotransferase (APT) family kinase protein
MPVFDARAIAQVVERALGGRVASAEHLPVGWGNENWLVRVADREELVLVKVAPPAMAAKWLATSLAYAMASSVGVPVPRLLFVEATCEPLNGWFVRILSWVDGVDATAVVDAGGAALTRFATGFGDALRRLHSVQLPAFSSRLDGSGRSFPTWAQFIEARLEAVLERAGRSMSMSTNERTEVERECQNLLSEVGDVPSPVLCHRDLHVGNLLATVDGEFAGLLDFDNAEAWDPAADFVKLRWQLLDDLTPEATDAFHDHYLDGQPWPPRWAQRLRLVDLVELTNNLANARLDGHADYEQRTRARLSKVLAGRS